MDTTNNTIEKRKNKHLNDFERGQIKYLYDQGYSAYKIGKILGRASNTIRNELKRGTVTQIGDNYEEIEVYYPDTGKLVYEKNRENSKKSFKALECREFLDYVEKKFFEDGWSLDATYGYVVRKDLYNKEERVCTKTLYSYVELGLLNIKNIDLPIKVRRKQNKKRVTKNKKILGKSIEERPKEVDSRATFGHWEIDSVIQLKDKSEPILVTITERKTRFDLLFSIAQKTSEKVNSKMIDLLTSLSNSKDVFKTITSDNGGEFSSLTELEAGLVEGIYYCHPNSPHERGTNERHNGLVRRFLPKGKSLNDYPADHIRKTMDWMNNLPRKILDYKTPLEALVEELNNLGLIDDAKELVQFDIAI